MMRSISACLRSRFAFDARRRFLGTDAGVLHRVQEQLDAVLYLKAKAKHVMHEFPKKKQVHLSTQLSDLGEVAKDPAGVQDPLNGDALERLLRVYRAHKFISTGATTACEVEEATAPADEHTFSHAEFPGYTDVNTSVLRMVDNKQTLVQRRQLSGLCYMNAPAVVQYYAIWHTALKAGQDAPGHGMLDLTHDIASNFQPRDLVKHVLEDEGASSLKYLYGILQPNSKIALPIEDDHRGHLRNYGPGLVAAFSVYPDFLNKSVHKHYEPQAGSTSIGLHAMVLVGVRVDSSGNHFYLLQNWWSGKQFVEVSQEYLDFCEAHIFYVVTPQTGVPKDRHTHAAGMHFAETEAVLEKAERLPMEMWRSPARPDQFV